jgi:hypothetical protein
MTRFSREDYERAADALSRGSIQFPVAVAVAALKLAATVASPSEDDTRRIGEAALKGMLDRKGIGDELSAIKDQDEELYSEIVIEVGRLALASLSGTEG